MSDIQITLEKLRVDWNNGKLPQNEDAWIIGLSGMLGAVIGGAFGGITGAVIGLLLGVAIGVISASFLDKMENSDKAKKFFIEALSAILGAVIGFMFAGVAGGIIGLSLGMAIGIISTSFIKKLKSGKWDKNDTWNTVLLAILGVVIGTMFGGLVGGAIGLTLGFAISITASNFFDSLSHPETAKALFRIVLIGILGAVIGLMFGGLAGGVIGLVVGLGIGFLSVQFDKNISAEAKENAKKVFDAALTAILTTVIGFMFGGVAGGVIGLTLGLAIGFASVTLKDEPGKLNGASRKFIAPTGAPTSFSSFSIPPIPMLARGAVIPPNREFMAVLGDQKNGTNIEAPLATIEQAVENVMSRRGSSGGDTTVILEVDGYQFGKATFKAYNRENRRIGVRLVEV